jgi:hypothetical protein
MDQQFYGRKIFGSPVAGITTTIENPNAGTILVTYKLTPSVARILTDNHVAVLTCKGGFACHGANVLRVLTKTRSKQITWITELPDEFELIPTGSYCEIYADGTVNIKVNSPINIKRKDTITELVSFLSSGVHLRCYWADRVYDKFSASLMTLGLSEDIQILGFDANALYGPDKLIWFRGNTPTSEKILELAQISSNLCKTTIHRQRTIYLQILHELKTYDCNNYSLDFLVNICQMYFSCFLLHHRTYSQVISRALEQLRKSNQNSETINSIVDNLFCTELVFWYTRLPFNLSVHKDFIDEPIVIPLPSINPDIEITQKQESIKAFAKKYQLSSSMTEVLCNIAEIFILKEWKFVINKLITSRIAAELRKLSVDTTSIRSLTIKEVLDLYYVS